MRASASAGFTVVEMLVATLIAATVCVGIVQLFHQNERVFRDQSIVIEMQQSARAAVALITDDIRLAGQGVPVYTTANHGSITEGSVVILNGSTLNRLQFRAGVTDLDSFVQSAMPVSISVGTATNISLINASAYSSRLGTAPQGRYVYVWDAVAGWARGRIQSTSGISKTLSIIPVEASKPTVQFNPNPSLSLEEAIVIFHDVQNKSIRRASATNLDDPAAPIWAPANEIAANVVGLNFRYFDAEGSALPALDTLTHRHSVARVDVEVSVQAASPLTDGSQPVYSLSQRTIPRNLAVR